MIQFLKASSSSFLNIIMKFSVLTGKYLEHIQAKGFFLISYRDIDPQSQKSTIFFLFTEEVLFGWLVG